MQQHQQHCQGVDDGRVDGQDDGRIDDGTQGNLCAKATEAGSTLCGRGYDLPGRTLCNSISNTARVGLMMPPEEFLCSPRWGPGSCEHSRHCLPVVPANPKQQHLSSPFHFPTPYFFLASQRLTTSALTCRSDTVSQSYPRNTAPPSHLPIYSPSLSFLAFHHRPLKGLPSQAHSPAAATPPCRYLRAAPRKHNAFLPLYFPCP